MSKLSGWLFKWLFPREYEHMRHLVDDVIRLEREKLGLKCPSTPGIVTGSNSQTFTTYTTPVVTWFLCNLISCKSIDVMCYATGKRWRLEVV